MLTRWSFTLFCSIWVVGCGTDTPAAPTLQSTSGGPTGCTYPSSPYGKDVGEVLSGNTAWEGFPAHSSEAGIVDITEFHDCDGALGVHGLLFVTITNSCNECQQHLAELESLMSTWEPMGVRIVVLVANSAQGAATLSDAESWKSQLGLDALAVAADPNSTFVLESDTGYPNQVLVDPRTMQVVHRRIGFDDDYSALEGLLAKNSGAL